MSSVKQNGRVIQTDDVEGCTVTTVELDFMSAADLLPELTEVVAPSISSVGDEESVGRALASMAKSLSGGKLVALLPRLLKGTTVVWPSEDGGKPGKADLTSSGEINRAFTGRKKLAVSVIKIALEVNFRDFFDAADLRGLTPQAQ